LNDKAWHRAVPEQVKTFVAVWPVRLAYRTETWHKWSALFSGGRAHLAHSNCRSGWNVAPWLQWVRLFS